MGKEQVFLAVDLGASGGRVVAGLLDGGRLRLEEVHRFGNAGVVAADRMYWDVLALWSEVLEGARAAGVRFGREVRSIGVDTWGVDFALLGRDDQLLGNPLHYRDRHTSGILAEAFAVVPREDIFAATGLQFMEINSLYQLWAMRRAGSTILEVADRLLMMPDLFHWYLTGVKSNEYTNATTTQMFDPRAGTWATSLLERFGLPSGLLGPVERPGADLGPLRPEVAEATGLSAARVVLPGTHDTASAVMAVPAKSRPGSAPDWCYISSGTWSLMGVETPEPIVNDACLARNFTNEGGVGDTVRLLKNIAGLWLVQECRRVWSEEGVDYDWDELVRMAEQSPPWVSLIDPDDARFVAPKSMPREIARFCSETSQPVPSSHGATIRCALESLALRYRSVLNWLEELVGARIETIHIVGGGARNELLCQMAADACDRPVVAGPVEATAIGNVMTQAVAARGVATIAEARDVVRTSFDVARYEPRDPSPWNEAYERFRRQA